MQVPEKLSLIGGSILLASTLIFTLKSQASNILPKVDSGMSSLVNADKSSQSSNDSSQNQQVQEEQTFNNNFQQAQQKGWQTGQWGSSKYYIDDGNNLHVGSGQLQGPSYNAIGQNQYKSLRAITLDGNVQAPTNSTDLFGSDYGPTNYSITTINGLNNLDTSQVTNGYSMFGYLTKTTNLDVSHFDTHNVNNMVEMFNDDSSLSNLDLSHFDTHNVTNMEEMFFNDSSLSNLDLSHFDTSNVNNMVEMFSDDNIHQLSLGSNTQLQNSSNTYLSGTYQSNGQTLNLDGNAHPGTWIKQ